MRSAAPTTDPPADAGRFVSQRLNWPLLLIAAYMMPVGVQAALGPGSFFDSFPVGRGWVEATGGSYNEHLARDVGVLFISLAIAAAWTAKSRAGDRPVAVAWLVQGLAHLGFHSAHLHDLGLPDKVALLASLAIVPALAVAALRVPGRPAVEI